MDADTTTTDGPEPPDCWAHDGKLYEGMAPLSWRLVNALWTGRQRTGRIDLLAESVFEDHDEPARHRYAPAASRANKFFAWHAIPWKVRARNGYLQLIRLPD